MDSEKRILLPTNVERENDNASTSNFKQLYGESLKDAWIPKIQVNIKKRIMLYQI
jgi:hypothetical protein